jgi:hypothetical protein
MSRNLIIEHNEERILICEACIETINTEILNKQKELNELFEERKKENSLILELEREIRRIKRTL